MGDHSSGEIIPIGHAWHVWLNGGLRNRGLGFGTRLTDPLHFAQEPVPAARYGLHASPSAMAYATVGNKQEVAIHLLYDRIKANRSPALQRKLLAHVMVHEITHVLEGIPRHSSEGIMKPLWDESDYKVMTKHPLPFAEEDIRLVHAHFGAETTPQLVPGAIVSASPRKR